MVFLTGLRNAIPKRIPTIKFRKGGGSNSISSSSEEFTSASVAATNAPSSSSTKSPSRVAIEDWQLPARYRRKELDDKEIEYINRGGPE